MLLITAAAASAAGAASTPGRGAQPARHTPTRVDRDWKGNDGGREGEDLDDKGREVEELQLLNLVVFEPPVGIEEDEEEGEEG